MQPRIIVVLPAYYAEKTIKKTVENIPKIYERLILCDDASHDNTYEVSRALGIETVKHETNLGYGGNQKTLYNLVRKYSPDVVAMIHPDNQYDSSMLAEAAAMIAAGQADLILGARMSTAKALGMPWWKILSNILLSGLQRAVYGSDLSEFHSGLRFFRANILDRMSYGEFSDDFVFDSQFIAWCFGHNLKVAELPAKCFYNEEVSSIDLKRSLKYGLATLQVLWEYRFSKRYKF